MKTRLLHLIFCVCAFHLAQVQSGCSFTHTDGREWVSDDKNCFCGPEKIPENNKRTKGPNSMQLSKLPMKIIHRSQDTSA